MKKLKLFGIIGAFTLMLGAAIGVGVKANENKVAEATSSVSVSGTRIQVEDVTGKGWTGNNTSYAVLDIYGITFVTGANYSLANIKSNDLDCQSYYIGNGYMHVQMKKISDGKFEARLPWYIQSFTTKFFATENNTNRYLYQAGADFQITRECVRGTNYVFKSDSTRAGWGGSNFYTDVSDFNTDVGTYKYDFYGIKSGSHMYLDLEDLTEWESDNAKMAIFFACSNINANSAWSCSYNNDRSAFVTTFAWKVKGSGNAHLYECIVPQFNGEDVYFSLVIGARFKSYATVPSSFDDTHNQTGDLFFNSSNSDCNMLWVNTATGGSWSGGGYLRTDRSISKETRAEYYGKYFNTQVVCTGAGRSSDEWNNVEVEYNKLSLDVRGVIYTAAGAASGTELAMAMDHYDYIVFFLEEHDDFIHRIASDASDKYGKKELSTRIEIPQNDEMMGVTTAIVASSVVAVAAIGGFFFIRKKHI